MFVIISLTLLLATLASSLPIETSSAAAPPPVILPVKEGTQKHVYLFLNHWFLQTNNDSSINGSDTNESNQTLWHRIAVSQGTLLRSSTHCSYLCINECGYAYSAMLPNSECLWSEVYDLDNYRFIFKQFGNRTAYLAVNSSGKLKRIVLLKKEKLLSAVEQTHVLVKEYEGMEFNKTCTPLNTKKLNYIPLKTCKNPPRLKNKRIVVGLHEVNTTVIDDVENNTIVTKNNTIVNVTSEERKMINDTPITMSNEIPVMMNNEVVYLDSADTNKTAEGVIPKNFYYHDEELSIRTLEDPTEVSVKNVYNKGGTKTDEIIEKVIKELITAGNSTVTKNTAPFLLLKKQSTSLRICFI